MEWIAFLQNLTYPVLEKCTGALVLLSPLLLLCTKDCLPNLHTRGYYSKYPSAEQARMRHWSKAITLESQKSAYAVVIKMRTYV